MTGAWRLLDGAAADGGWETRRVGDLVELTNGFPFDSDLFGPEGTLPLVRIRDLFLDEFTTYVVGPIPSQVVLREGDIVIGMDGDFELTMWRRGPAALNQRMCLLRPRPGVDARFVGYSLPRHLRVLNDLTYATTVKHLSSFDILSERIPCPSRDRQRVIADYLDLETARIDAILSRRRHQVELVEQRRRTLLGDAMSGRLTETLAIAEAAPRPLRLYVQVDLGRARSPENASGPHMVRYLRAANVKDGYLELDSVTEMNFAPREQSKYALRSGDVLVTEGAGSLAAVGANAVWNSELDGVVCFQNHLLRLRARDGCHPRFLAWWARFAYETGLLAALATGAQILNLGAENVRALRVQMPSYAEQADIAKFLDASVGSMESALIVVERQVALLLERRQALITAAVTGQLAIPGVAA
jgi:type I restriction enzyme S subunit